MKEYLNKIVDNGSKEDMECIGDIFLELLDNLKETNKAEYNEYKNTIKGIALNHTLDEEMATEIVHRMIPLGEVWDIDTIKEVTIGNNHNLNDLYVVMNSLANDYSEVIPTDEVTTYVSLTNAWLDDKDSPKNKTWWYFMKKD